MPNRSLQRRGRANSAILASHLVERLEQRTLLNAIPVGPEFRANTYTGNDQAYSSIAMDNDGNFVMAWQSAGQDGSGYGIYAQRYNAAGVVQGGEFRVNTHTALAQRYPAVAMDADGDFVAVWESFYQDAVPGYGVYAQRYNAAGVPQGGEFRVNTYTTGAQKSPTVAMDGGGNFVVVWRGDGVSGGGVLAQRYNAAGVPQGSEFRVNTNTGYLSDLSIAMDTDGDFVVAWHNLRHPGSIASSEIQAQRYNSDASPLGTEFQVNTYTTDVQSSPSVAMDTVGNFVVAWESMQDNGLNTFAQRYSANGAPQGGEFRVNTLGFINVDPSVAMDNDGDFVIAWQSYLQDSSHYGVYAQRYNSAGVAEGMEFRVNTHTPNRQDDSAVAMDSAGDFAVAWTSYLQDGSGYGAFAQRYAVVPELTSSSFLFDSSPHRLRFRFNHDVRESLSTDDLLIRNLTTGQTIPSNQFVLLYDQNSDLATYIYLGPGSDSIAGVLPDGRYRATLLASGIITPQGAPLAADHNFDFFFLNGDANHDGRVNINDFTILASNFGESSGSFTQGDFNYDGVVNVADFTILAGRFGTVLAPNGSIQRTSARLPLLGSPFAATRIGDSRSQDDQLIGMLA